MGAPDAKSRARLARRGLAHAPLDKTTHAMLLRQLYMAQFEARRFEDARLVAESAIALRVLTDVLHHDASRAAAAAGDIPSAISHLRIAARRAPAARRSVHLWTLGSTLFHARRYDEAIAALERAVRWSTRERPLYRGQLALVRIAAGESVSDLQPIIDELRKAPCGQGYGLFVLGHLAYCGRAFGPARRYLSAFVRRTESWPVATSIVLEPEVALTRATLAKMAP